MSRSIQCSPVLFPIIVVWLAVCGLAYPTYALTPYRQPAVLSQDSTKVWVNTASGVYHCPGTRYYGKTRVGIYLLESEAKSRGYRAAANNACAAVSLALLARERVWVNTATGAYHCSGSRYYGKTKVGKYLTEADARKAGYHAAYGRPCAGR